MIKDAFDMDVAEMDEYIETDVDLLLFPWREDHNQVYDKTLQADVQGAPAKEVKHACDAHH